MVKNLWGMYRIRMNSALYWTAMLIGLLAIYIIYVLATRSVETFQAAEAAPVIPENFNEITNASSDFDTRFPHYNASKVFAYVSAFSRVLSRENASIPVYSVGTMRWHDLINTNDFNIQTSTSLPASLISNNNVVGLPLNNIKLENISPSEAFGKDPSTGLYELGKFSVSFFMKWNTLTTSTQDKILFEMFAETPNYVALKFANVTSTSVTMQVILGDVDTMYTWEVPKSTLMSNGNNTLYTFVFNPDTKTMSVFIGFNEYKKTIATVPTIRLSNSKLAINSNRNIDATLKAFVFFKDVALSMSDLISLNDYFVRESGSTTAIIGQTVEQLRQAQSENERMQAELDAAREQLAQCSNNSSTQETNNNTFNKVKSYKKWEIKTDNLPVDAILDKDLKKCTALEIKDFGEAKPNSLLERQLPPDLAAQTTSRNPFTDYDIRNPTRPASSTPASNTAAVTPSSNATTPASNTAVASTRSDDTTSSGREFVEALYNTILAQRARTEETQAVANTTPASTPINDTPSDAVEETSFFGFISKYM